MIVEIPDSGDFAQASINLLNLAWQIAADSVKAYGDSEIIHPQDVPVTKFVLTDTGKEVTIGGPDLSFTPEEREAAETEFWRRSQPSLGNALSLVQQTVELGLKGRIAGVSPYLLISRDARDYPSGSAKADVPFSAFRTLDAADLLRVHNAVCARRLGESFAAWWDAIRRQRNALIHSVSPGVDILRPDDVMEYVLVANKDLHGAAHWFDRRLSYRLADEIATAHDSDPPHSYGEVFLEFSYALRCLRPQVAKAHLGYDRRAKTYYCTHCCDDCSHESWDYWDIGRTAQFRPMGRSSTTLRCVVCQRTSSVLREPCPDENCISTVRSAETEHFGTCLVCRREWGDARLDKGLKVADADPGSRVGH